MRSSRTTDRSEGHGQCPGPLRIEVSPSGRASFCACLTCRYARLTIDGLTISSTVDPRLREILLTAYSQLIQANNRRRTVEEMRRIADLVLGDPTE